MTQQFEIPCLSLTIPKPLAEMPSPQNNCRILLMSNVKNNLDYISRLLSNEKKHQSVLALPYPDSIDDRCMFIVYLKHPQDNLFFTRRLNPELKSSGYGFITIKEAPDTDYIKSTENQRDEFSKYSIYKMQVTGGSLEDTETTLNHIGIAFDLLAEQGDINHIGTRSGISNITFQKGELMIELNLVYLPNTPKKMKTFSPEPE